MLRRRFSSRPPRESMGLTELFITFASLILGSNVVVALLTARFARPKQVAEIQLDKADAVNKIATGAQVVVSLSNEQLEAAIKKTEWYKRENELYEERVGKLIDRVQEAEAFKKAVESHLKHVNQLRTDLETLAANQARDIDQLKAQLKEDDHARDQLSQEIIVLKTEARKRARQLDEWMAAVEEIKKDRETLRVHSRVLEEENGKLRSEIRQLRAEVAELRERLARYEGASHEQHR